MSKTKTTPDAEPQAAAWRWICPVCDERSGLFADPALVRTDFADHADQHVASEFMPFVLGDLELKPWKASYALQDVAEPAPPPTPAQVARDAADRIASLMYFVGQKLATMTLDGAPTFDTTPERVRVSVDGRPVFTVTLEMSAAS